MDDILLPIFEYHPTLSMVGGFLRKILNKNTSFAAWEIQNIVNLVKETLIKIRSGNYGDQINAGLAVVNETKNSLKEVFNPTAMVSSKSSSLGFLI